MKKFLFMAAAVLAIASCEKKQEAPDSGTQEMSHGGIDAAAPDPMLNAKPATMQEWESYRAAHESYLPCDTELYDLSEKRHNISEEKFDMIARESQYNPADKPINYQKLTWDQFSKEFEKYKIDCFDGWLEINYDSESKTFKFSRSDSFDNYHSLFSSNLRKGIANKLQEFGGPVDVELTNTRCPVMHMGSVVKIDKVAFRVSCDDNGATKYLYYDMSDDPL